MPEKYDAPKVIKTEQSGDTRFKGFPKDLQIKLQKDKDRELLMEFAEHLRKEVDWETQRSDISFEEEITDFLTQKYKQ